MRQPAVGRLGEMIDRVSDLLHDRKIEKLKDQAEEDWKRTLDKLWPLKSSAKQNCVS